MQRDHLGALSVERRERGQRCRAVRAVDDHLQPVEAGIGAETRDEMSDIALDRAGIFLHATHRGTGRTAPLLVHSVLDGVLDVVVEFHPAAGEELDAVVGHRVVAGREHHAQVGVQRSDQMSHTGRRDHTETHHVDTRGSQPGDDRRLEELTAGTRVASDQSHRTTTPVEGARLAQNVGGSDRQLQRDLGGQFDVRGAADPVRAEESSHRPTGISACCTGEPCGPS